MLGPLLLLLYRLLPLLAMWMPKAAADAFKARCALKFSLLTDGGLDDDFTEEAFQIVRKRPELLARLDGGAKGDGFFAMRRRMQIDTLRHALATGRESIF